MNKDQVNLYGKATEFVFLYESIYANPNGDPQFGNRPRRDDARGTSLTSPMRIERTVRDYIIRHYFENGEPKDKDKNVYYYAPGRVVTNKEREEMLLPNPKDKEDIESKLKELELHEKYKDYLGSLGGKSENESEKKSRKNKSSKEKILTAEMIKDMLISQCIDVRWFGGLFTGGDSKKNKGDSGTENETYDTVDLTGPIQIHFGRSLHETEVFYTKITSVFSSASTKSQGSIGDMPINPYALIAVYGRINPLLGEEAKLTKNDVELFFRALWLGTNELNTKTKNQISRALIRVDFDDQNSFLGDFVDLLELRVRDGLSGRDIRSVKDYTISLKDLDAYISEYKKISQGSNYRVRCFCNPTSMFEDVPDGWMVDSLESMFKVEDENQEK